MADQAARKRFCRAALTTSGRNNDASSEPYHLDRCAAFVLDSNGNDIEAVFHGPAHRSAESVIVTPQG